MENATPRFSGKVAVITGAGSGIGRAVALAMQSAGYTTWLAGRHIDSLAQTKAMAAPDGGKVFSMQTDVSQPASVHALFSRIRSECDRVDVLFNNAGVDAPGVAIEDLSYDQWSRIIGVNLTGSFLCAQEAIRLMKSQQPRGGRIINNGSIAAHVPRPHSAPYTATKHAIAGLTKCISLDGRACDIVCSQIDIGNAITEMSEKWSLGALQANGETIVEPRIDVKHVAEAVLYMSGLPLNANVQFITLMASKMPFIGRG